MTRRSHMWAALCLTWAMGLAGGLGHPSLLRPAQPAVAAAADGADEEFVLPTVDVWKMLGDAQRQWTDEGLKVLREEGEDAIALRAVTDSCLNVTKAIVEGAQGHKGHIIAELRKICVRQSKESGNHTALCDDYGAGLALVLGGNPVWNMQGPKFDGFCFKFYKSSVLAASRELLDEEEENTRRVDEDRRAKAATDAKREKSNRLARTLRVLADSEAETMASRAAAKKEAEQEKRDKEDAVSPETAARKRAHEERQAELAGGSVQLEDVLREEDIEAAGTEGEAEQDALKPLGSDQDDTLPPEPVMFQQP